MVSPRNSRSKSLCISRRVIGTPRRARNSANMAPPGPPPTMQQEVCWTSTTSLSVCCVCTESAMGGVTESSLVGRSLQTNSSSKDSNGGAIWSILSQTKKIKNPDGRPPGFFNCRRQALHQNCHGSVDVVRKAGLQTLNLHKRHSARFTCQIYAKTLVPIYRKQRCLSPDGSVLVSGNGVFQT